MYAGLPWTWQGFEGSLGGSSWQVQLASASRVHALGDRGFGLMRTKLESGETVRLEALRQ